MAKTSTQDGWESRWRQLRKLEQNWPDGLHYCLEGILTNSNPTEVIGHATELGLAPGFIEAAEEARLWSFDVFNDSPVTIFDDVYHAALYWRLANEGFRGQAPRDRGATWLYRGENKCFAKTSASMHRLSNKADLEQSLWRLERFVDAASALWPWLDERQLIALAQHYGGEPELRLQTWLLDVTWDPYVAFFFASYGWNSAGDGGEWAQVGRVTAIKISEWRTILPNCGEFEIIRVPGFSRIRHQRALFLDAPDPSIVEDYSPFRTRFYQKPGMVFSDRGMSVSEDFLLDTDASSDVLNWEKEAAPQVVVPTLRREPRLRPESLNFDEIATVAVRDTKLFKTVSEKCDPSRIIRLLGRLHSNMRDDDSIPHVSIFSLHSAVSGALVRLSDDEELVIQDLARAYLDGVTGPACTVIRAWLAEADEVWKTGRGKGLIWL